MKDANAPELLAAKLLFANKPALATDALAAALRRSFSQVDNADNSHTYLFPDYPVTFADGKQVSASLMLTSAERPSGTNTLAAALQQTWHWQEAATFIADCRHEVIVTDFMTRTLPYKVRVELFQKALDCFVRALQPRALYFVGSSKLVEPQAYLERGRALLEGLMNVRFYTIADSPNQEMLLDTLGLPDFQIRFAGLDPNKVVGLLTSYGYYLFENGLVIEDGNTIAGLPRGAKWTCRHTDALLEPARLVIELDTN
ncbi:DUF4261 domain-containing protein [Hymenobacter sp.]|jgi:hypothetical protein|uniref:DUF4261 domain-containing protein n=1 Tax=Hymenobacter sp. TaxID=1898978 RepID=UPI002ED8F983